MALVPFELVSQLKRSREDLIPLTNPNKDQVLKKMGRMTNILQDEQIPEDVKTSRLNEEINKYSIFANKLLTPLAKHKTPSDIIETTIDAVGNDDDDEILSSLPKTYQTAGRLLLNKMRLNPQVIKWDPVTNEVRLRGKVLKGSNIIDLVGNLLRPRKNIQDPVYSKLFLKTLADLNFPEELVKNKVHIKKFRSFKQGTGWDEDEEDGDISGYENPPPSPSKLIRGKRKRRKRFDVNWSPIKDVQ